MFDFSRFLDVGDCLVQFDDEACIRSAISRYYYAIFCCIRRYLIDIMHEYEFEKRFDVHNMIYKRLILSNDSTERSLGESLNDLRELRNCADYDWKNYSLDFFKENLLDVRKESKLAIQQIRALRNSPPYDL